MVFVHRAQGGGLGVSSAAAAWRAVGPLCVSELPSPASLQSSVIRQGNLHVKLTRVDGKVGFFYL